MHNKELVEGVNISNFLLYLAARPIAETSGTMLVYSNKANNQLLLETNKNIIIETVMNSVIKSIPTTIISIAKIVILIVFITIICCVWYFHKPDIQLKYK